MLMPVQALTFLIEVDDTSSGSVPVPVAGPEATVMRVFNDGPNTAFIAVAAGDVTAEVPSSAPTDKGIPVPPLSVAFFSIPAPAPQEIDAVCRAGETAKLFISFTGDAL
jgi:hypothetical protein